jgi:hypothetical protein
MKKLVLVIILFVFGTSAFAGENNNNKDAEKNSTKLISGKVLDKATGEEIAGAEVKIADKIYLTDLNGNFSVLIPTTNISASVSFVSYNNLQVEINPFSYQALVIELEAK